MTAKTLELRLQCGTDLLPLRLRDMPYGGLFVPLAAGAVDDPALEPGEPVVVLVEVGDLGRVRLAGAVLWRRLPQSEAPDAGRTGVGVGLFPNYAHVFDDLLERFRSGAVSAPLRAERRRPLSMSATWVSGAGRACEVRDLSSAGMRVVGRGLPAPGTRHLWSLDLGEEGQVEVAGEVRWAREDRDGGTYGVRFDWAGREEARGRLGRYLSSLDTEEGASKGSSTISTSLRRVR